MYEVSTRSGDKPNWNKSIKEIFRGLTLDNDSSQYIKSMLKDGKPLKELMEIDPKYLFSVLALLAHSREKPKRDLAISLLRFPEFFEKVVLLDRQNTPYFLTHEQERTLTKDAGWSRLYLSVFNTPHDDVAEALAQFSDIHRFPFYDVSDTVFNSSTFKELMVGRIVQSDQNEKWHGRNEVKALSHMNVETRKEILLAVGDKVDNLRFTNFTVEDIDSPNFNGDSYGLYERIGNTKICRKYYNPYGIGHPPQVIDLFKDMDIKTQHAILSHIRPVLLDCENADESIRLLKYKVEIQERFDAQQNVNPLLSF